MLGKLREAPMPVAIFQSSHNQRAPKGRRIVPIFIMTAPEDDLFGDSDSGDESGSDKSVHTAKSSSASRTTQSLDKLRRMAPGPALKSVGPSPKKSATPRRQDHQDCRD